MLTARQQAVDRLKVKYPEMSESEIRGKLVMYSSDQSNSAVEKSAHLSAVPIRLLSVDGNQALRGETLQMAVDEDLKSGKFPIACITTLGTTGTCAFDNLNEIGPICQKYNIWLHIDAAFAGSALCCPEYRPLMQGIEYCDSFNFNLHKWMQVNFDCCAMWFKNADTVVDAFTIERIYLNHQYQGQSKAPDYRNWQIPLGRRFRALKVWITLRTIGAEKIRETIRYHCRLGKMFENKVRSDSRFEIVSEPVLSLVCFKLRGSDEITKTLLDKITERKNIYMIPAKCNDQYMIRFVVCGLKPEEQDIEYAWKEISSQADLVLGTDKKQKALATQFTSSVQIGNDTSEKTQII